jgi:agmatinase
VIVSENSYLNFLDLPDVAASRANVLLLPLPYEGTVSYGGGTSRGPEAVWRASTQIELWDEELGFDLESLSYHSAPPVLPQLNDPPADYLTLVLEQARFYQAFTGLVVGIGGEHSVTPPLVEAAVENPDDLEDVTIVQFDAHADLRPIYDGSPYNHACAMRRLVDRGARLIAVGIRSFERDEHQFGRECNRVRTFTARDLATVPEVEAELLKELGDLTGRVYLTVDIDALEVCLCPGTGTPQPGGLSWWTTLRYLRRLLNENGQIELIGCDVVETVPQRGTQVNETVAAGLLAKILAYHFALASGGQSLNSD